MSINHIRALGDLAPVAVDAWSRDFDYDDYLHMISHHTYSQAVPKSQYEAICRVLTKEMHAFFESQRGPQA